MTQTKTDQMIQIRWHGRGGQGAITAAKVVAEAALRAASAISFLLSLSRKAKPNIFRSRLERGQCWQRAP